MWCRLAGISGCACPRRGPHCPPWCPPRGPCRRLSLQVGCRLGCPPGLPWPPGWREQLPVGLPGREMLTLTAGVRSPHCSGPGGDPAYSGLVSDGVSWPGACDPPDPGPCRSPPPLPGTPRLSVTCREGGSSARGAGLESLGTLDTPCPGRGCPKAQHGAHMGARWGLPGPWVFLIPLMGARRWWDRSGPGSRWPGGCAAGLGSP